MWRLLVLVAAQEHIRILKRIKEAGGNVETVGVADVWDGNEEVGRGLYPSAKKIGLDTNDKNAVTKDYRRILDRKDVDVTLIATPDHWHAKQTIDALNSGKDVYCEKPMTHTIDEARQVAEAVKRTGRVMTVGVQSTADPLEGCQRHDREWQDWQGDAGPDELLPQQRRRPMALLQTDEGHESEDDRLEDVPWHRFWIGSFPAVQSRPICPMALLLGLWRRDVHGPVCAPVDAPDSGHGRSLPKPRCGCWWPLH